MGGHVSARWPSCRLALQALPQGSAWKAAGYIKFLRLLFFLFFCFLHLLDTRAFAVILSRSVYGVFSDLASFGHNGTGYQLEHFYEASISTVENPPQTAARIPEPQLQQERARHPAQPPPKRAQTPDASLRVGAWPPGSQGACGSAARRVSNRGGSSHGSNSMGSG